ncbi:homologous-pairing protein 2 homolog [Tigriopus californicus]|uniref:homologous-pairing protein 2 homolog n=1 Tax=Tigriopus californicus TaxID=6832 RepID=UPI0027DA0272|nr:homologous-pairing protein 2 homolog [Tigriopus californicus]|eukprot:TCALIF_11174-PA protein Name:"Similar to PSMC3IP Homologous-pairing protein 2 homolog (Homo sapiens)" AED:0.46 eAED:0.46 QI:0/-1/0/1/-1/1/1/0/127
MAKSPENAVEDYLRTQNRPYSANDIVLNLHKEHGKTAVQKALDLLVADGKVSEKLNGKQKQDLISREDKRKLEESHESAVKEWRKRKRICLSITDAILESYPKPKKALFEDIGIETDEDVGAKVPDI